jgi:hypothetical protein
MNRAKHLGMWGLALAVCLAAGTSAFAKNSHQVELQQSLAVNGTPLAAGEYTVSWEGQGASATVSFAKGNKVVATAPAKLVDVGQKFDRNRVDYEEDGKGAAKLTKIRLAGTSQSLVFTQ